MIRYVVAFIISVACCCLSSCISVNYLFNRNEVTQQFIIVKKFPDKLGYFEKFLQREMTSKHGVNNLVNEKNGDTARMIFQLTQNSNINLHTLIYRCGDTTGYDSKNNILLVGKIDPVGKIDTLLYQKNDKKIIDKSKKKIFFFWKKYYLNY